MSVKRPLSLFSPFWDEVCWCLWHEWPLELVLQDKLDTIPILYEPVFCSVFIVFKMCVCIWLQSVVTFPCVQTKFGKCTLFLWITQFWLMECTDRKFGVGRSECRSCLFSVLWFESLVVAVIVVVYFRCFSVDIVHIWFFLQYAKLCFYVGHSFFRSISLFLLLLLLSFFFFSLKKI